MNDTIACKSPFNGEKSTKTRHVREEELESAKDDVLQMSASSTMLKVRRSNWYMLNVNRMIAKKKRVQLTRVLRLGPRCVLECCKNKRGYEKLEKKGAAVQCKDKSHNEGNTMQRHENKRGGCMDKERTVNHCSIGYFGISLTSLFVFLPLCWLILYNDIGATMHT